MGTLGETFDLKEVRKQYDQNATKCSLCEEEFGTVRNRQKNCKRCYKPVCDNCSTTKRILAVNDKEERRVCDECDTQLDNFQLIEDMKQHDRQMRR